MGMRCSIPSSDWLPNDVDTGVNTKSPGLKIKTRLIVKKHNSAETSWPYTTRVTDFTDWPEASYWTNKNQTIITYCDYIIYNVLFSTKHDEVYKETVKCDPYSGKKKVVSRNCLSMSSDIGFSRPTLQSSYIRVQRSKWSCIWRTEGQYDNNDSTSKEPRIIK